MKRLLLITHDQRLDRRSVSHILTLRNHGWTANIVALSHGPEPATEEPWPGVTVHRVGLATVRPGNPIYRAYLKNQDLILEHFYTRPHQRFSGKLAKAAVNFAFRAASKLHWEYYRRRCEIYYRSRGLHDPLPFFEAFYGAGKPHRSDIVIAHDLPSLRAAWALSKEWGVPLIYDAHELYPEQITLSSTHRRICMMDEAEILPDCALVSTVNRSIAEEMAARYGIRVPHVWLNVLDPDETVADVPPDRLRETVGVDRSRQLLLYQGGYQVHRNLEDLVRSFGYLRQTSIHLAMMGFGGLEAPLRKIVAEERLQDRVHFVPAAPQAELLSWTRGADAGIIPYLPIDLNTRYCTPNKLFEFIQAGIPILAHDAPELRRIVAGEGIGHIARLEGPRRIAEAIRTTMRSPLLDVWRRQCLRVQKRYTWSFHADGYAAAVEAVAAGRPPPVVGEPAAEARAN